MEADEPEWEIVPCPLCSGTDFHSVLSTIDHFYGVPGKFDIVRCDTCQHHFQNPRPTEETVHLCYPSVYAQHGAIEDRVQSQPEAGLSKPASESEENLVLAPRPWYARPPIRWIPGIRWLYRTLTDSRGTQIPTSPTPDRKAIELGCGVGSFLNQLRDAGWSAQGVELSSDAVKRARAKGHNVTCGLIGPLQFDEKTFDAVFSWMVIEHLQDPMSTFRSVHQWLKPGGHFCFSVPNYGSGQKWFFGQYWQCYDLPRHLQHFNASTLIRELKNCGFTEVRITHQRSIQSWYASLGARLLARNPESKWGQKLLDWFEDPPFRLQLMLSPIALMIAMLRQSERLTIVAKK